MPVSILDIVCQSLLVAQDLGVVPKEKAAERAKDAGLNISWWRASNVVQMHVPTYYSNLQCLCCSKEIFWDECSEFAV